MENNKADKEAEVDDMLKDADQMVKKLTGSLKDFEKLSKNFAQIKEVENKFATVGKTKCVARRMNNRIVTLEFLSDKDQKEYFDSLKK